jgi:hypothetical protein
MVGVLDSETSQQILEVVDVASAAASNVTITINAKVSYIFERTVHRNKYHMTVLKIIILKINSTCVGKNRIVIN